MAQQRRRQRPGHGRSRLGRLGRLALVGLILVTGCTGEARDPVGLGDPPGGGGGGGGGDSSVLIGRWQRVILVDTGSDLQTTTTEWTFAADGACRRDVTVRSLSDGATVTSERLCRFATSGDQLIIRYADAQSDVVFRWSLAAFSSDRLLLDTLEFQRLA